MKRKKKRAFNQEDRRFRICKQSVKVNGFKLKNRTSQTPETGQTNVLPGLSQSLQTVTVCIRQTFIADFYR